MACTLAWTLVCEQLEALPAVALKASDGVSAEVFAAAIVKLALIDICGGTGEDILTALQPDVLHKSVTLTYCNNGPIPWCGVEAVCELAIWPLHVFPSGCSVKPTGQLQRTPVDVSLQVQSHPPLFTAQVSEITAHEENASELPAFFGEKRNIIPQCQTQDPY